MTYSEEQKTEIITTICEVMAKGNSLRSALKAEGMPTDKTFFSWIESDEDRLRQYTCAREAREDFIFEEMIEIADMQGNDVLKDKEGNEYINHNVINRNKLMIETRRWNLSRMNAKKYSDKSSLDVTTNGKDITTGIVSIQSKGEAPDVD